MHPLVGLAQLLAIGFGLYLITLIIYTMWGLTHPHRQTYAYAIHRNIPGDPSELDPPIPYEQYEIKGVRSELAIWSINAKNPEGPCVIMTHGWGSSKLGGLKRLDPIFEHASEIILWDLPGHGESTGITHLGADEHHDLARVIETLDADRPIVLYGWSLGAGVSLAAGAMKIDHAQIAQANGIAGIICESPYINPITPARNVIGLRGIPYRLNLKPAIVVLGTLFRVGPAWRGFARDRIAKDIHRPILILHGDADPVCPINDAQRIAQWAPDAQLITIVGGGHNNLWTDELYRQQMCDAIGAFVSRLNA